jgi:CheY-like chemotaxis protein
MLAYELYLGNKDSKANVPFRCNVSPIEKIYFKGKKMTIDTKTREQYGSEILTKYRILQEALSMPLNTCDSSGLNLPDERTSTNEPNPYVEIHGNFKRTRSESKIVLSIQTTINDQNNLLEASYDISKKCMSIHADKDIRLRIDNENYQVYKKNKEIKTLFEEYINNGILTKDGIFSAGLFTKIAKKFFSFVKSKWNSQDNRPIRLNFSIYVLPSDSTIKYVESKTDNTTNKTESFTDSFGNDVTAYASTSTTCTKFLSFYEKAFTINCKEGSDFYQNIGIGRESLPHIHLPLEQTFSISGLRWVFMDLRDVDTRISEVWAGILSKSPLIDLHLLQVSTGRYDDSTVLDICTTEELVANREKQEKRSGKRILIVDDELDIAFTLRIILEENGFKEVDVYNEPLLALQNFKSRVYSLLITDIAMPGMNGFELYKHVKKLDNRIKVVFVTASEINYEALKELSQADQLDISDDEHKAVTLHGSQEEDEERIQFIRKPVEIKEFIQKVTKELQQEILDVQKIGCHRD